MKYRIKYYKNDFSQVIAPPVYIRNEIVETEDAKKLDEYIINQKDSNDSNYRKQSGMDKICTGLDYVSDVGCIKIEKYKEPEIINLDKEKNVTKRKIYS